LKIVRTPPRKLPQCPGSLRIQNVLERSLAPLRVHGHFSAFLQFAEGELVHEGVLDLFLNHLGHWPRAVGGVVSLFGQVRLGRFGQVKGPLLGLELVAELVDKLPDDLPDYDRVQVGECDDLVQAVAEFGQK
jgi:hypothetical protein